MRRTALIACLTACALGAAGPLSSAALAQSTEYELNLPSPSGGSVDPSDRAGGGQGGQGEEPDTVEPTPATTPATAAEPSVTTAPVESTTEGERKDRGPEPPSFPRGQTFALGPVQPLTSEPVEVGSANDDAWVAVALVAGLAGILVGIAIWRLRSHGMVK